MAVILFTEDTDNGWKMAGWVVRQVLDDVLSQYPSDSEMASKFVCAKQSSGLVLSSREPEFAARATEAIRHTVTGILSGKIRSGLHDNSKVDAKTERLYLDALAQLLDIIPPSGTGPRRRGDLDV